jgi:peptidoglycan/LPS O-acetylase OafA/YrhL
VTLRVLEPRPAVVRGRDTDRPGVARGRDANLDVLRALAIVLVVAYHLFQMSPVPLPAVMSVATFGQYGVDLFFALSGWLIGTLFWREQARFGNVNLWRFWARRWMRTIPPYLVALLLAWPAAFAQRREPFDWGYLLFVQNYYAVQPFFLVSWSLCVEEHFYLLLPLLLAPIAHRRQTVVAVFVVLILVAPVSRFVLSLDGIDPAFGFEHVATHLRMEGLLLGFLAAWVSTFAPGHWSAWRRHTVWWIGGSAALLSIALGLLSDVALYRVGLTLLALALVMVLVALVGRVPSRFASSSVVRAMALMSYSVYLTHALMIHAARWILDVVPAIPWPVYFPLALSLVGTVGAIFYAGVERTAIVLRDRWIARRASVALPAAVPGSVPA